MSKLIKVILSLIICVSFVGALGSAPAAKASPSVPPQPREYFSPDGATVAIKLADRATAAAPFTAEQRRNAKPMDLMPITQADLRSMPNVSTAGTPGSRPSGAADPAAIERAKAMYPESWDMKSSPQTLSPQMLQTLQAPSLVTPAGTKNTFDGYMANYWTYMYTQYPFSTVGKLYFWAYDGSNWVVRTCSAGLISSNDVLVTAAHCVFNIDIQSWNDGWEFVPADVGNGSLMPYGYFDWDIVVMPTKYTGSKKFSKVMNYDIAVIHLQGYPSSYVGWTGYAYNQNPKNVQHAIGYPDNIYSGYYTYVCVAESLQKKSNYLGMGCDMTGSGTAGAPWFLDYQPYNWYSTYADAVSSGYIPGAPNVYGPKFASANFVPACLTMGYYLYGYVNWC
jgi:V8-like Glu-specific endopeptidase